MKQIYLLILTFCLCTFGSLGNPEGTKELNTNGAASTILYLCNDFATHCNSANGQRSQFATYDATQSAPDNDRLYFTIANGSEAVYMGFKGTALTGNPARHIVYQIREKITGNIVQAELPLPTAGAGFISTFTQAELGPNQLIPLPPFNGYDAVIFTPPGAGTYYIEFSVRRNDNSQIYVGTFSLDLIDLTVANVPTLTAKPGRVYSKAWQFSESNRYYSTNYIISDDSIVTSAAFSNMQGGAWVQYCNQTGCGTTNWITDRKSLYHLQALYPQYKIFVNSPDPALFPPATTLGQIVSPPPWGDRFCNTGHILFHIHVNKPGNVELQMSFSGGYVTRLMNQPVVVGENLFDWDGLDGTIPTGVPVPNNITVTFTIKYINGLTNLPLYDVEGNQSGFTIALVAPAGASPAVFWDDTNISGGTNNSNPPGCVTPPCHSWSGTVPNGGWGNLNTVNTWWYNVSTTTSPAIITQFRIPQTLVFQQTPPFSFCENTSGHIFSVATDPNTDIYHFSYTPAAGVTITQATPGSNSITIDFGPGATSGTLSVYGSNTNCASNGPTSSVAITIVPLPLPVITGPASVCAGSTGNLYSTQTGKTNYQWSVSPGGFITSGGGTADHTAMVTWNTPGAGSVSVNFTDNGCTATNPVSYPVTVHSLPVPVITGVNVTCVNSTGNVYTTATGKINYVWNISAGGTITSGGTSTDNSITVSWSSAGPQMITVNYTEPATGCTAASPFIFNINVQALTVPTIFGLNDVCIGIPGMVYSTESGQANYIWTVSAGGLITGGGTSTDNTITITWNTTGAQQITVTYINPITGCNVATPTIYPVNVKPLPVPAISGNAALCSGSTGITYTTQSGQGSYVWGVSAGAAITAGGGTNDSYITVNWNAAGAQSISVNYNDAITGCTATAPVIYPVTVYPLPVPSNTGNTDLCEGTTGIVYTTEAGKLAYAWVVSAGGTATSGGGPADHTVTVTWHTAGAQTVSVEYTNNVTNCVSATPTVLNVTVKPLPFPGITGSNDLCSGSAGNVYTTDPGKLNYIWTVSPGGTITAGGGAANSTITVTWNTPGSKTVTVNYTDNITGCTAVAPTSFSVNVKPLPIPALSGPASACINTSGPVFTTDAGMNSYQWSIVPPSAGTITSGSGTNTVNVTWTQLGIHAITINYIHNITGCTAPAPTSQNVLVNTLPVPAIAGAGTICSGIPTTYTTQTGVSNYIWTVSAGGTIVSGGNVADPSVTVNWTTPGANSVSVNYTVGTGCTAGSPTVYPVTVNQSTPPVVTSPVNPICETYSTSYTVQAGMTGYTWAISTGGTFISPITGNSVAVLWNTAGARYIDVNFTNGFGCTPSAPTRYNVTVNALPVTTISQGPGPACQAAAHMYQVPPDPSCTFTWSVIPAGNGLISAGQGTAVATIDWVNAGNCTVSVTGTNNTTGCFSSGTFPVTVHPAPAPSFTACFDLKTTSTAKKFTLRGGTPYLPVQGVYSGNRVSYNAGSGYFEFDPFGASAGNYPVIYTFTNNYGCVTSTPAVTITVVNSSFSCGGDLTDVRDGKKYRTSTIGGRCWMKENLAYGTILSPESVPQTDNCIPEKYCLASDATCSAYGGLYQWNELMAYSSTSANQGLCPPEWHVPTETEWQTLITSITTGITPPADGVAGSFIKDIFLNPGFLALTKGIYYLNNTWSFATGSPTGTLYWTSTPGGSGRNIARGVNSINPSTSKYAGSRENAFSVRCVKD